jgi:NDP-sugar pyrophosphorylase family protein
MTVLRNDCRWDKSNILFKNGELIEYDKKSPRFDMRHIDFGLSVLSKHVFLHYPEGTAVDLADICRELSKAGQVAAFEVSERFYEIGSPQGIRDTEEFLAHQELPSRRSINE